MIVVYLKLLWISNNSLSVFLCWWGSFISSCCGYQIIPSFLFVVHNNRLTELLWKSNISLSYCLQIVVVYLGLLCKSNESLSLSLTPSKLILYIPKYQKIQWNPFHWSKYQDVLSSWTGEQCLSVMVATNDFGTTSFGQLFQINLSLSWSLLKNAVSSELLWMSKHFSSLTLCWGWSFFSSGFWCQIILSLSIILDIHSNSR